MRIAVCLKWVADLDSVDVDPYSGRVDESRLLYVLDPGAESALALAVRLGEVTAFTVGGVRDEDGLRLALAAGAKKVVRIRADPRPALTAPLLARAIAEDGPFDVVLTGTRSVDRGSGEVPSLLASVLGLPVVTDVRSFRKIESAWEAEREQGRGTREVVEVLGPAVLALLPDLARLETASLPRLLAAKVAAVEVRAFDVSPLATDPVPLERTLLPPRPRVHSLRAPSGTAEERLATITQGGGGTRARGRLVEGSPAEMADAIVTFLRQRGLLDGLR